jgi:uncharacterized protein (DUF2249 family)
MDVGKSADAAPPEAGAEPDELDEITRILVGTLRALGAAGRPVQALRLAASGYAVLRRERPLAAQRINAVMHSLARMPPEDRPPTPQEPSMADTVLDVRTEIPRRRHELIFESFESLAPGTAFELVNDHDPKPLFYQFEAEQPGKFTWDYLEEGPEVWRVRIGRN